VKNFCERYEEIVNDLETLQYNGLSPELTTLYKEMNDITNNVRQKFIKNYPCVEIKSQFKNGKIQITEVIYSEKFLSEIGHSFETFTTSVLQEGLPRFKIFPSMKIKLSQSCTI